MQHYYMLETETSPKLNPAYLHQEAELIDCGFVDPMVVTEIVHQCQNLCQCHIV